MKMRAIIDICAATDAATMLAEATTDRVRKKSTILPPMTSAFKQWFGNSKVVDRRGRPLVCYHGTYATFDRFDPESGVGGLSFFSTDPKMANGYAANIRDAEGNIAAGAKVIPVYLRIVKPYDYRKADNENIASQFYRAYGYPEDDDARRIRISLYGRAEMEDDDNPDITDEPLEIEDFIEALNQGAYPALEMGDFLDFLHNRGYDGIVTYENRAVNFGVFNAAQVKSVFAKEFNPNSDHLSEEAAASQPVKLYHITSKANFKLNRNYAPKDNAFAIWDRSGHKGIYLTPDVERWVNGYDYIRPFVAEIYADPSVLNHDRIGRWGGEIFVPADQFDKLKVNRVVPLDVIAREKYGEHGWIEDSHGHEFDTGKEIKARPIDRPYQRPFKDYQYDKDARTMSPDEVKRIKQHFRIGYKNRLKYR